MKAIINSYTINGQKQGNFAFITVCTLENLEQWAYMIIDKPCGSFVESYVKIDYQDTKEDIINAFEGFISE